MLNKNNSALFYQGIFAFDVFKILFSTPELEMVLIGFGTMAIVLIGSAN